ncbi:MAG: endo-1,4-beta-xylanase [Halosimplex sp.]
MSSDDTPGSGADEADGLAVGRRSLLGTLAAVGLAGCPGRGGKSTPTGGRGDGGDGEGDDGSDAESATNAATDRSGADAETDPAAGGEDGTDAASASVALVRDDEVPAVEERIAEHRTSELTVEVTDADGNPVDGAEVEVAMQDHAFGFGTAVNAGTLIEEASEGDNYREYIPELFNKAVLENGTKWAFWERDPELADAAVDWLLDRGLDVRGHVCIWGREGSGAIPSDVQTAIENRDAETIRSRSMDHIEEIITHYGEKMTEWGVVNEAMHAYQLQLGVYGDKIDQDQPWTGEVVPWTSELLAEWYAEADAVREADDLDVGLGVNDFNQFAYDYTDDRYETEIDHINENGAQLDTVGLQGHVAARTGEFDTNSNPDGRVPPSRVKAEIDQFADHGAAVKITEFDTYGGNDWANDAERAEVLRDYLRGAFSHPDVTDFLMWGFWDGRHWRDEAPLFYDDWTEKPAYDVWTGLVFDEWWTEESGSTESDGTYAVTGFHGEYEVTAAVDGETVSDTATLPDGGATVELSAE